MRRYDDPVEVRRGDAGTFGEGPDQFLWRGRLWKVRSVLAHWMSTETLAERELWRVEAGRGISTSGVFDLSFDFAEGHWQLVGCAD